MHDPEFSLTPKDFIETQDGLLFAVLSSHPESGRIPAYLRYRRTGGGFLKISSGEAGALLEGYGSRFYFDSDTRAIRLQGVSLQDIHRVFRARERSVTLLAESTDHPVLRAAQRLLHFILQDDADAQTVGVTGSLLVGAQTPLSDIDLVAYGQKDFDRVRNRIIEGIQTGFLKDLSLTDWSEAHARRGSSLTLDEYLRHERRKGNKALVDGIKFDLTLMNPQQEEPEPALAKGASMDLRATVTDATDAFGFPARYLVDHPDVFEVLAFSQTYAGQAFAGERIWARGRLEVLRSGRHRLVVAMDREAQGEFIKLDEALSP